MKDIQTSVAFNKPIPSPLNKNNDEIMRGGEKHT
jgi:hypothetical protein